jgi:hypothetical protein
MKWDLNFDIHKWFDKMYSKPNKNKITFESGYDDWKAITIEFPADSCIDTWKDVFKTLMVHATFCPSMLDFLDNEE